MQKTFVSNSEESTRMFKAGWMEAMSKVHWSVPLFIYIPLILFFFFLSVFHVHSAWWFILLWFAIGIAVWSITEYLLHRFVFHYHPKSETGKRVFWIFHGVHHDYPNDKMRLVMPPSVSIPLAAAFYFLFKWLLPSVNHLYAFFPGFLAGYLCYDMMHYAIHHFNSQSNWIKTIKKHHMMHHYQNPERGFGVSSNFWDNIFRSNFVKRK
jgi:sterol desaturase/sphingolipid hydroxylase (fatty acid hydroxylase superfamily)